MIKTTVTPLRRRSEMSESFLRSSPYSGRSPKTSATNLETVYVGSSDIRHHRISRSTRVIVVSDTQVFPVLLRATPEAIDFGEILALQRRRQQEAEDGVDDDAVEDGGCVSKKLVSDEEDDTDDDDEGEGRTTTMKKEPRVHSCGEPHAMPLPIGDFVGLSRGEQLLDVRVYTCALRDVCNVSEQNSVPCISEDGAYPIKVGAVSVLRPEKTHITMKMQLTMRSSSEHHLFFIRIGIIGGYRADALVRPVILGPFFVIEPPPRHTSIMDALDNRSSRAKEDDDDDDSSSDDDDDDEDDNKESEEASAAPSFTATGRYIESSWMLDSHRTAPLSLVGGDEDGEDDEDEEEEDDKEVLAAMVEARRRVRRRLWVA